MERSSRGQNVSLSVVPLDLAPILRELLFDRLDTVVLTSATLAAAGEFDFLESRLGLNGESSPVTVREIFPSPFDYPSQCVFGVPNDLPEPRDDEPGHGAAVVQVVSDLAYASDGGMFVLFTSHAALRRAAQELRAGLGERWPILVQGESPRDVLLRRFREAENAILLGTDSFWEGVDVPGRALRTLVLNKLPFKVPSEPITAARLERLAEAVRRVVEAASAEVAPKVEDETIPVELGGVTRLVRRSQVRYVEAHGDYARLHTATGSHLVRIPLTTLAERWAEAGFVRIHRSTLVALPHVDEIRMDGGRCLVRLGERTLQVSRRLTRQLQNRLSRRG
jgi:hypothetical protein